MVFNTIPRWFILGLEAAAYVYLEGSPEEIVSFGAVNKNMWQRFLFRSTIDTVRTVSINFHFISHVATS